MRKAKGQSREAYEADLEAKEEPVLQQWLGDRSKNNCCTRPTAISPAVAMAMRWWSSIRKVPVSSDASHFPATQAETDIEYRGFLSRSRQRTLH